MNILQDIVLRAKKIRGTIVFAEGDEERTLEAAVQLKKDNICKVILVAINLKDIDDVAKKKKLDITGIKKIKPSLDLLDKNILEPIIRSRKDKGFFDEDTKNLMLEPLNFSALYVKSGKANGCIAGARSDTANVLRSAIRMIGTKENVKYISSFFLMIPPEKHKIIKNPLLFADCAVNAVPSSLGLFNIAVSSVESFKKLFPKEQAKVAFLSFSTKGSAQHASLKKVRDATALVQEYFKTDNTVIVDGEMQFDAAVMPKISSRKAPNSELQGNANILIFPDLNSGNICYKVTERLGYFKAVGPIIQGLAKSASDLSRGCSVEDIYHVAVINLLQSI